MDIRLLTNAPVNGVLRSPAEGVISVPAAEGRRLIDEKKAEDPSPASARKSANKALKPKPKPKPKSPRARKPAAPKAPGAPPPPSTEPPPPPTEAQTT
jgi:hypothetical protein